MNKTYSFGLVVLGVALLTGAAFATDNAGMTLDADVIASVEVTVSPASINNWALSVGTNTYTAGETSATISSNFGGHNQANLYVKETAIADDADGFMENGINDELATALAIDAITSGANDINALSGSNQQLYALLAPGSQTIDFDYKQAITYADPAGNDYSIVVTFTGIIEPEWV
jgi:hypothetical protein